MQLNTKTFWEARHDIWNADMLLFRNGGLIPIAGRGKYSHAAMAGWWGDHLMCLELRELRGGRAVTLWSQVRRYPGKIDVYRPKLNAASREAAFRAMRGKAGHDYDYWGILKTAFLHLPFIREIAPADTDDLDTEKQNRLRPEYCSAAVANAYRIGSGVDPVPNLADAITEPNDLARSPMFDYLCTLDK